MAGMYFMHGECGQVEELCWTVSSDGLNLRLELAGDPHRRFVYSYGSDIGIDPAIRPGQKAVFLRLCDTAGLWTDEHSQTGDRLEAAMRREASTGRFMLSHHDRFYLSTPWVRFWLPVLWLKRALPIRIEETPPDNSQRPATPVTVFLSYSSPNAVVARQIYDSLSNDGKADVWFDLAQPAESATHDRHVEHWLERAVHDSRVFVVLLTQASITSRWVAKEIEWAVSKASDATDFHLVLLRLADVASPQAARVAKYIIDCHGMYFADLCEALYSGVYNRRTRREWLGENPDFDRPPEPWEPVAQRPYFTFESDGGVAVDLEWKATRDCVVWNLRYRDAHCDLKKVRGPTPVPRSAADLRLIEDVVDPGIREGDRIGCGRANFRTWPSKIWMRSDDISLTFEQVADAYEAKVKELQRAASGI